MFVKQHRIAGRLGFMFVVFLITACSTASKSTGPREEESFKKMVEERIGSPLEYISNEQNDKVLCIKRTNQGRAPREEIKFLVWDLEKAAVMYESSIDGGKVEWLDDNHLEVFRTPGMIQSGESMDKYIKVINVNTRKAVTKEEFLKSKDL